MVDISIADDNLVIDVLGIHKVFALRSQLTVPLSHVRSARHDAQYADRWWHGIKMMGSDMPGVFAAGTFWSSDGWRFWDVRHPDNAIVIELHDEHLAEIIVEVEDPAAMVGLINNAVRRSM